MRRGKSSQAQPGDQVQEQRDWGQKEREESEPALEHGAVLVLTEDRDPAVPAEWAFVRLVNHPGDPAVVLVDRDVGRRRRSAEPAGERLAGPGLDDNAKRHRDPSCRLGCRGRVPASGDLLERGVNRRIADEVVAPDFATDPVDPLLTGLALADVSTPPAAISDSVPIPGTEPAAIAAALGSYRNAVAFLAPGAPMPAERRGRAAPVSYTVGPSYGVWRVIGIRLLAGV